MHRTIAAGLALLSVGAAACSGDDAALAPPVRSGEGRSIRATDAPGPEDGSPAPRGPAEGPLHAILDRYATDGRAFGMVDAEVVEGSADPGQGRLLMVVSGRSSSSVRLSVRGAGPAPFIELRGPPVDFQPVDGDVFSPGICRLSRERDGGLPDRLTLSIVSAQRPGPLSAFAWRHWAYAATGLSSGGSAPAARDTEGGPGASGPCDHSGEDREGELRLRSGDVGPYLRIRLQVLTRFMRERRRCPTVPLTTRTDAAALEALGVDVNRLLLGLVIDPDVSEPLRGAEVVDARVLAQWIRELRRSDALVPALAAMVHDDGLDDWDRVRAQLVLADVAEERFAPDDRTFDVLVRRAFGACAQEVRGAGRLSGWGVCE